MSKRRKRKPSRKKAQPTRSGGEQSSSATHAPHGGGDDLDALWDRLRTGAANVAGVSFQTSVAVWLIATGRAHIERSVVSVRPEGFEDVDCEVPSGSRTLFQAKERGPGARAIGVSEVARIVAHAAPALLAGGGESLAVITNGRFGGTLPAIDASSYVTSGTLPPPRWPAELVVALESELTEAGQAKEASEQLLSQTRLLVVDFDLAAETEYQLREALEIHPAIAALVRPALLERVTELAVRHRSAPFASAGELTTLDVAAMATRIAQDVDLNVLDEAVLAGVCEPANFVEPPPQDRTAFLAGVDVRPSHIGAGYDVLRPVETTAVLEGLASHRDVVIAGPSGSGKSALLWRSLRLVSAGTRAVRVLRVADAADVETLVRHVRRLAPRPTAPVIVAADDLGREHMAGWIDARRRLAEVAGLLLISAVRHENLTPLLTGSAVVVDPRLDRTTATVLYSELQLAGHPTVLALEESIDRSDGLLMEFIALVTTGRRIRDVLAEQLASMNAGDRPLRRSALRLVCAAHLLGSSVHADRLPAALEAYVDDVWAVMASLQEEHLVVNSGGDWRALHDLRAEVLFDLLHKTPPPTRAASYALALTTLDISALGAAARVAAVRVSRELVQDVAERRPGSLLELLSDSARPIAESLAAALALIGDSPEGSSERGAAILDAAVRVDAVVYAYAVLPFIEKHRKPTIDRQSLSTLVFSTALGAVSFGDLAPAIDDLAKRMPPPRSRCAERVVSAMGPEQVVALVQDVDVETATRFLEAAETAGVTIDADTAASIWASLVAPLPHPPGTGDRLSADHRSRLTATICGLSRQPLDRIAEICGPVEARLVDAVAADEFATQVDLRELPLAELPESSSNLVRVATFRADSALVADLVAFGRPAASGEPSGYPTQPGGDPDSVNEQAVSFVRRVLDACPEVDLVNIKIVQANGQAVEPDGTKNIRAGVLPRPSMIAKNVAFQAAVAESAAAEYWTTRLRKQAEIAGELVGLLRDLPRRLEISDASSRRRSWEARVRAAVVAIADLPGRPIEQGELATMTAAEVDESLRKADRQRSALDLIAGALLQVADSGTNRRAVVLAGVRMADAPARLAAAREDGCPFLTSVGETLPEELDDLSEFAARLLTACDDAAIRRAINRAKGRVPELESALATHADEAAAADREAAIRVFADLDLEAEFDIIDDRRPVPPWRRRMVAAISSLEQWIGVVSGLQESRRDDREQLGLTGSLFIAAEEDAELLPFGLTVSPASDGALPVLDDVVSAHAESLGRQVRPPVVRTQLERASRALVDYSYEQVRALHRPNEWTAVSRRCDSPATVVKELREQFAGLLEAVSVDSDLEDRDAYVAIAVALMIELAEAVEAEDPREGLAVELANIDFRNLSALEEGSLAHQFSLVQTAALEAERRPASSDS